MLKIEKYLVSIWCGVCLFQAFLYDPFMYVNMKAINHYLFGPLSFDNLIKADSYDILIFFAPMLLCGLGIGIYGLIEVIQKKTKAR